MKMKSRIAMLKSAGIEMMRANSNFLMPLADFTRRNTRPILNTLTTLSSVGEIGKSPSNRLSNKSPIIKINTDDVSKTYKSLTTTKQHKKKLLLYAYIIQSYVLKLLVSCSHFYKKIIQKYEDHARMTNMLLI